MADIIGEDIFDIQTVFDMYTQSDTTKIGRKCYNAIKNKGEKLEDAASKLLVSVDTNILVLNRFCKERNGKIEPFMRSMKIGWFLE